MLQALSWFFRSPQAQGARRLAKILFLLALLGSLLWVVPIQRVVQALLSANPVDLLIGMAFGFVSVVLTAGELAPLTRHQGIPHGWGRILAINLGVKFYAQFAPSTLVGSGIRWYRLAQPDNKAAEALAALAFFRMLETFVTLTTGFGFFLLSGSRAVQINIAWILAVIAAVIVAWIVITRYSLAIYRWFTSKAEPLLDRPFWRPITRRLEKFLVAVSVFADIPAGQLFLAVLAGVISTLTGIVSSLYLARAVGIRVGFMQLGWVDAILQVATQLPFAVAGGLGIREATLVTALATIGVSADLALALSFLLFVRSVLFGLLGGLVEAFEALRVRRQSGLDLKEQNVKEH